MSDLDDKSWCMSGDVESDRVAIDAELMAIGAARAVLDVREARWLRRAIEVRIWDGVAAPVSRAQARVRAAHRAGQAARRRGTRWAAADGGGTRGRRPEVLGGSRAHAVGDGGHRGR